MADAPIGTDLDISVGSTSTAVRAVLDAKYNDANGWAQYAVTCLQEQLASVNTALTDSELKAALATLKGTLEGLPVYTSTGAVTYTAPGELNPDAVAGYVAPAAAVYEGYTASEKEAALYVEPAPDAVAIPGMIEVTTPDVPVLLDIPGVTAPVLPDDPAMETFTDASDVVLKLSAFHDKFMTMLDGYADSVDVVTLRSDMLERVAVATDYVGVAAQHTAMLDRANAITDAVLGRLNNQLEATFGTIASSFSARGFDVPPGALTAKQTEAATQAGYALADATAQIGREMLGIEGQIITGGLQANAALKSSIISAEEQIITAELQANTSLKGAMISSVSQTISAWVQAYTAYFDRGLKYVMDKANMSLETFKAKVQAQLTLMDTNKAYIQAIAEHNSAATAVHTNLTQVNLSLLGVNKEKVSAATAVNTGLYGSHSLAVQAVIELYRIREQLITENTEIQKGVSVINQGKAMEFETTAKGNMMNVQADVEKLKADVIVYEGRLKNALNEFQAQVESEKLKQIDGEQHIRRAEILANLSRAATQLDIEYAGKELMAELEMAKGMTSAHSQMIAAALNGVSVQTSFGYKADSSYSTSCDTKDQYGKDDHPNPRLPVPA
jgi:hypothetical protein